MFAVIFNFLLMLVILLLIMKTRTRSLARSLAKSVQLTELVTPPGLNPYKFLKGLLAVVNEYEGRLES